jgi:hypothetical protein
MPKPRVIDGESLKGAIMADEKANDKRQAESKEKSEKKEGLLSKIKDIAISGTSQGAFKATKD